MLRGDRQPTRCSGVKRASKDRQEGLPQGSRFLECDATDPVARHPTFMDASNAVTTEAEPAAACDASGSVHEVDLFGAFVLRETEGGTATPPGRKPRALLAAVLLAAGREMPRERLAALLWSRSGEDQARASLRQTLYELRPWAVGPHALVVHDRVHVRIRGERVRTDLDLLRELQHSARACELAARIGDQPLPLLRDFDGIDPAFDEWLAVERVQRHDERRRIMLSVGLAAVAAGCDLDGAQRLAAALLAADPFDEAAARLSMEASHRRGDRDGVRVAHLRLETALRRELGTTPSVETRQLRERLMATSVLPEAPVVAEAAVHASTRESPPPAGSTGPASSAAEEASAPASASASASAPTPASFSASASDHAAPAAPPESALRRPTVRRRPGLRFGVGLAASLLLLGGAAFQGWRALGSTPKRALQVDALTVSPADRPAQALRLGLAAELSRVIVGSDSVLVVVDGSAGTENAERSTGSVGSAEIVVTGEARSSGGLLHANLRMVGRRDGAILWSDSFTRSENDIEPLREQMAAKLADVALCAIDGGRKPGLAALGTDTMRLFLAACEQKHGDWALSAKLMRQIVARQPDFAHGWAMLSAATAVSAAQFPDASAVALRQEATDAARRALALDKTDGEAYFGRAMAMPDLPDWLARQQVLEAGLRMEPANAQLNSALAQNMADVGRWREAIAYGERAIELDPFSPGKASQLAKLLAFGGDLTDAQLLLRAQRRRFPQSEVAARTDLLIEAFVGDSRRASRLLAEGSGRVDMSLQRELMWRTLIAAREEPSADRIAAAVSAAQRNAGQSTQSRVGTAVRLAALGRTDLAYALAESLPAEEFDRSDLSLLFWNIAAPFRADPRFMALAARHGMADIWLKTGRWPDFCLDHSVGYDCRAAAAKEVQSLARRS